MDQRVENGTARSPDVDALRTILEPHIVAMEDLGHLPGPAVEGLRQLGIFRMFAPKQLGGEEWPLPEALDLIQKISRVDASMGWVASITGGGCLILPKLPMASLEHIYRSGPDQIVAGSALASGSGRRVPDGWRISGRWPLASGCMAADWILTCFKEEGSGEPMVKAALLPAEKVRIDQTWRAMGLRGTGSHHLAVDNAFVPDDFVFSIAEGPLTIDSALYRRPPHVFALMHGAVHLGVAQAAMDDAIEITKHGENGPALLRRQSAYFDLGWCEAKLKATQAALNRQVELVWKDAVENTQTDAASLPITIQLGVYIAGVALEIVRKCFELGGSAAVYDDCPLQRRLRDIQVATQHGLIQRANFISGGMALLDAPLHNDGSNALFAGKK
ncbi:acyl-CoA dehydrogenase family protein [Rhizobium sp. 2MFCol3.1]|uniref:acyl-CoA dehydrogenase family protein n=1 Tax=Rhizobium sp. 2MFCol3.1 TaxID=1246459 RepID=UPI00036FAEAF|nr:acyl-CoA dehydrogenase family protein [Rhizobium sp. 2MFCol3.1]